jgi:hypothetical protein
LQRGARLQRRGRGAAGATGRRAGYLERFAACFDDHRDPDLIEHPLLTLLRQRTYGLGLGGTKNGIPDARHFGKGFA